MDKRNHYWILDCILALTAIALGTAVRSALNQLDSQLLVTNMQPLSDFVDRAMASTRFAMALIAAFAAIAATLAAVGLYGVL